MWQLRPESHTVSSAPGPQVETVVMKFGGSSVSEPEQIREVARRLVAARERGVRVVGTVSAMGRTTDALLELARQVSSSPDPRELDMLLSTGERTACALVAMAVHDLGHEAVSFTGSQAGIITDAVYTKAKIREITPVRVLSALDDGQIVLVAGFQGFSRDTMDVTTLGRGGTDATAVALAAALDASCEIYSDVLGVFTADPRVVPEARKLHTVSYEEMLEMAASGAKVLMLRAVEMARAHGVRIHARSTFSDEPGTWIEEVDVMEQPIVSAVTHSADEVVFTLSGIPDEPGSAATVLEAVADEHVNVDTILQNVVHGPEGGRAGHAPRDRRGRGGARADGDRRERRSRQGVPDRSRNALASGDRGEDVPHPRERRDKPADDLDVPDQDLLHDRPRRRRAGGPLAARGLRPGERGLVRGV